MSAVEQPVSERILDLTRTFDAPRELVFTAWIEPEHFARWCAPAKFDIVENTIDARRGGVWWSKMRAPDGEECIASGVYREIVEPERLVFTYAHEMPDGTRGPEPLVTVAFDDQDGKTVMTLHQEVFDTVENRVAHSMGWGECLERLAGHLAEIEWK